MIRLVEEILHQLIGRSSHYLQGFLHRRWCRISSINSRERFGATYPGFDQSCNDFLRDLCVFLRLRSIEGCHFFQPIRMWNGKKTTNQLNWFLTCCFFSAVGRWDFLRCFKKIPSNLQPKIGCGEVVGAKNRTNSSKFRDFLPATLQDMHHAQLQ